MKNLKENICVENSVKIEIEDALKKTGVPFSLKVHSEPRSIDALSDAELDTKLQHSYAQSLVGKGRPMNEIFDNLERDLK